MPPERLYKGLASTNMVGIKPIMKDKNEPFSEDVSAEINNDHGTVTFILLHKLIFKGNIFCQKDLQYLYTELIFKMSWPKNTETSTMRAAPQ